MTVGAGEFAEVDEVGAAAYEDVLRVDDLVECGVRIGVGTAANVRFALEHDGLRPMAGQRDGSCETCNAGADDEHICMLIHEDLPRDMVALIMPRPRMASLVTVGTETRSRKTAEGSAAMRSSRPW